MTKMERCQETVVKEDVDTSEKDRINILFNNWYLIRIEIKHRIKFNTQ